MASNGPTKPLPALPPPLPPTDPTYAERPPAEASPIEHSAVQQSPTATPHIIDSPTELAQQPRPQSNPAFPPRKSSILASSLSRRSIDRKPLPGPDITNASRSRYRSRRISSGLELEDQAAPLEQPPTDKAHSVLTASSGNTTSSRDEDAASFRESGNSSNFLPPQTLPIHTRQITRPTEAIPEPSSAVVYEAEQLPIHEHSTPVARENSPIIIENEMGVAVDYQPYDMQPQLQYFHEPYQEATQRAAMQSNSNGLSPPGMAVQRQNRSNPDLPRPHSTFTMGNGYEGTPRGRDHGRHLSVGDIPLQTGSPTGYPRGHSSPRYSPDNRPQSYVDLLHVPYPQQVAPTPNMDNSFLRSAIGANASLLDTRKTLEMYKLNVKKTNEPSIQYEFAVFMVQAAMESPEQDRPEMIREAKLILQKLSDRGYPFAQYYLGDGYASGLFNKGKEDHDRAFTLFVGASKHGHAESGYRAALCYEFGWGCRRDYAKAVQFYRTAASKNHPGAATRLGMACLEGTMGLTGKYKEGVKWLKRAAESADPQYNAAPYELARLHETGFGDDIFKDEVYAAQLYTQSAELGHPEANLVLGKAYEHGLMMCPKDAALSIHFYTGAARGGLPEAMMALCAWYLFGAEPILEKNENEAFEWAKRAADLGMFIYEDIPTLNLADKTI